MDLSAIGQQFGLTEEQTRAAFDALTPVVASGVRRTAQSETGLQDILNSALNGNRQLNTASGNDVLGQIFGSKDVSRGVAQQLSATSGIGAAVLKQLLPIIASIVMGQVAKKMGGGQSSGGGGLGDILGDILGGGSQQQQPQSGGGGLGDILKDILGGGAQPETVNHGRKRLDDVLGGGTQRGTDADILLDSVTRSVRR